MFTSANRRSSGHIQTHVYIVLHHFTAFYRPLIVFVLPFLATVHHAAAAAPSFYLVCSGPETEQAQASFDDERQR